MARDTYCHACGTAFPSTSSYPRRCAACGLEVWANPIPVAVVLAPVTIGARTGLLVVRRAIPPGIGKLALVGGFLEEHEPWQVGGAREVREETGVAIDPATLAPFWFTSTEPRPDLVLLFGTAAPQPASALAPFTPNAEVSERGLVFGPAGLDDLFAFSLHVEAARRWFTARGERGAHDYAAV
jgi:ADP-ribose pyrophosphatase YjhB (NUDIX family)